MKQAAQFSISRLRKQFMAGLIIFSVIIVASSLYIKQESNHIESDRE